jgi:hypothetical protein
MEMVLPCNASAYHLVRTRYKQPARRSPRLYPAAEEHQIVVLDDYAKFIVKRRHEKLRAEALSRILARARELTASAVVADDAVSLERRFQEQADKWATETRHLSSPAQKALHPSYQAVLGMASENKDEVIRLLLLDLQRNRRDWFWALSYLAGDNPITQADAGRIDKMIGAWVKWGRENHFL